MRVGELLELKKENVYLSEQYAIGGNKTEAGRNRIIPFHDRIVPFITERLERSNHIVINEKGQPIMYQAIKHRFYKLMGEYGWEHKIHDTRKTAVSIMHSSGIPIETIRVIVGHSGKGVTETHYLYKQPSELVEMVNRIEIK